MRFTTISTVPLLFLVLLGSLLLPANLFAEPVPRVRWSGEGFDHIQVSLEGEDGLMDRCLNSGFTLHYRFTLQLCEKSSFWFDTCNDERQVRHSMSVDPLSESYSMESDRYGDVEGPQTTIINDAEEARYQYGQLQKLPLSFLVDENESVQYGEDSYVSVRVISHCEGEVNKTLSRISSFLTLGLVRISGFNTGWVDFVLIQVPPTVLEETE